ncbi:MAG: DUF4381 family protein [Thiohalophilus sp.]
MDKSWAGIIAPDAPPADTTQLLWWLLPILVAVLVGLYYRHRPRPAMRRRLRRLQRTPGDHERERRHASFLIADCLRRACATTRLDQIDPGTDPARWQAFVDRLQQAQYRPQPPSPTELDKLFREAREWLRR